MKSMRYVLLLVLYGAEVIAMNALKQRQKDVEVAEKIKNLKPGEVVVTTSDGKSLKLTQEQVELLPTIKDARNDLNDPKESIPLKLVSYTTLSRIISDLAWVQTIQETTTNEKEIIKTVKGLPIPAYSMTALQEASDALKAAHYLDSAQLTQRYARDVAMLLTTDTALASLYENNSTMNGIIDNLSRTLRSIMSPYILSLSSLQERLRFEPQAAGGLEYEEKENKNIFAVAYSPDGTKLAVGIGNRPAVYDAQDGILLFPLYFPSGQTRRSSYLVNIQFSPDGQLILAASNDRFFIFDANNGLIQLSGYPQFPTGVAGVGILPNNQLLVAVKESPAVNYPGLLEIWNQDNSPARRTYSTSFGPGLEERKSFTPLWSMDISSDKKRVVIGREDSKADIWSIESKTRLAQLTGHTGAVLGVAYSYDGNKIATGSRDTTAKIWDVSNINNVKVLHTLNHEKPVTSVEFSPDGTLLLTAPYRDTKVWLWDVNSGKLIRSIETGGVLYNKSMAFSPDGSEIAVGSNGEVVIWKLGRDFDHGLLYKVAAWAKRNNKGKYAIKAGWARAAYNALNPQEKNEIQESVLS